jgi:hypothetical protein
MTNQFVRERFFRPFGAGSRFRFVPGPTAYAVGFILLPLRAGA